MPLIDLSHLLTDGMAVYPGDEIVPEIRRLSDHGAGSHRSSAWSAGCHSGTHIDLPLHFRAGEPDLAAYPLDRCRGTAVVVDAPQDAVPAAALEGIDLAGVDFVLLRTGWEEHWGTPRYYERWPWLAPEAAERLAASGLKGVGLDSPSVDPFGVETSHRILAAAGMINIENLAHLGSLPRGRFAFWALPLRLDGAEASPVRAAAEIAEE